MGSRFLLDQDGGDNLAGLTTGDFEADLAKLRLQSLVASTPLKSTSERMLTSGLISMANCSFTAVTGIGAAGGAISLLASGAGSFKGLTAGPGIALDSTSASVSMSAPQLEASTSAIASIYQRDAWTSLPDPGAPGVQVTNMLALPSGRIIGNSGGAPYWSDTCGASWTAGTGATFPTGGGALAYSPSLGRVLLRNATTSWRSWDAGVTWTISPITSAGFLASIGIVWSRVAGLFIWLQNGTPDTPYATSPDGVVWTSRASTQVVRGIVDAGSWLVIVGENGSMRSADGLTWAFTSSIGMWGCVYDESRDCIIAGPSASIASMYESYDRGLTWVTYPAAKPATLSMRVMAYVRDQGLIVNVQRIGSENFVSSWDPSSSTVRVASVYGSVSTGVDPWRITYVPVFKRIITYASFLSVCSWSAADANLVAIGSGAVSGSQLDLRALSAPAAVRSDKYGKVYLNDTSSELRLLYNSINYTLGGGVSRRFDASLSATLWTDGGITFSWEASSRQLRLVIGASPWYSATTVASSSTISSASTITAVGNHTGIVSGVSYYVAGCSVAVNSAFALNAASCEYHVIPGAGSLASSVPAYRIFISACPGDVGNFEIEKCYQPLV